MGKAMSFQLNECGKPALGNKRIPGQVPRRVCTVNETMKINYRSMLEGESMQ